MLDLLGLLKSLIQLLAPLSGLAPLLIPAVPLLVGAVLRRNQRKSEPVAELKAGYELVAVMPDGDAKKALIESLDRQVSAMADRTKHTRNPYAIGVGLTVIAVAALLIAPAVQGGWWWLLWVPIVAIGSFGLYGLYDGAAKAERTPDGQRVKTPEQIEQDEERKRAKAAKKADRAAARVGSSSGSTQVLSSGASQTKDAGQAPDSAISE